MSNCEWMWKKVKNWIIWSKWVSHTCFQCAPYLHGNKMYSIYENDINDSSSDNGFKCVWVFCDKFVFRPYYRKTLSANSNTNTSASVSSFILQCPFAAPAICTICVFAPAFCLYRILLIFFLINQMASLPLIRNICYHFKH